MKPVTDCKIRTACRARQLPTLPCSSRGRDRKWTKTKDGSRSRAAAPPSASVEDNPKLILPQGLYCETIYKTQRRPTRTVWVGPVPIGSEHPIARQTMTTTDTKNVDATVEQVRTNEGKKKSERVQAKEKIYLSSLDARETKSWRLQVRSTPLILG